MLVNRLPQLMQQKEISIRQLSRATGITYTTIQAVYHGRRRSVQLQVLDAICGAINVQPGDIYRYVPAAGETVGETEQELPAPIRTAIDAGQIPAPSATKRSRQDWRSW